LHLENVSPGNTVTGCLLSLVLEVASVIFDCFSAAHCCYVSLCYVSFLTLHHVCRIFHWSSTLFHFLNLVSSLTIMHLKTETNECMFHSLLATVKV